MKGVNNMRMCLFTLLLMHVFFLGIRKPTHVKGDMKSSRYASIEHNKLLHTFASRINGENMEMLRRWMTIAPNKKEFCNVKRGKSDQKQEWAHLACRDQWYIFHVLLTQSHCHSSSAITGKHSRLQYSVMHFGCGMHPKCRKQNKILQSHFGISAKKIEKRCYKYYFTELEIIVSVSKHYSKNAHFIQYQSNDDASILNVMSECLSSWG